MGKPILLLRLEGPLQSWGVRSRWDVRDSSHEPSKSGVIGLLGCALGFARGDELLVELDKNLRFGVRTELPGRLVTDYQTITDFLPTAGGEWKGRDSRRKSPVEMRLAGEKPATIISPRQYLEDAAFLVALEAKPGGEFLLDKAATAVQNPRWPIFLGRKCCVPVRPIFERYDDIYADIEEALRNHEWNLMATGEKMRRVPSRPLTAWVEGDDLRVLGAVSRPDALRQNSARLYDFRVAVPLQNIAVRSGSDFVNEVSP